MAVIELDHHDYGGVTIVGSPFARRGHLVGPAGDFDGDGFDDLLLRSSHFRSYYQTSTISVLLGGPDSLEPGLVASGDDPDQNAFGSALSTVGDINGDGFADIIVGDSDSYEITVFFGRAAGESGGSFRIFGDNLVGMSLASAGDVDGDGFDEIIIGVPSGDEAGDNSGTSYVLYGKADGFGDLDLDSLPAGAGFEIFGADPEDFSGSSVSSAGDVNGDGFDDMVIGAPFADNDGGNAGAAYVVFGKADGPGTVDLGSLAAADGFVIEAPTFDHHVGRIVTSAGDVNGDGYDDVAVAGRYSPAYIIFGKEEGFGTVDLAELGPEDGLEIVFSRSLSSLDSAGDVNGDGFDDIILGRRSIVHGDPGEAYLIFGKAGGFGTIDLGQLESDAGIILRGGDRYDAAGTSVAGAGDLNGDGFDDIAIGAPGFDSAGGNSNVGAIYVIYGGNRFNEKVFAGTAADETVAGGIRDDDLSGGGGDDILAGRGGDDRLRGGNGDDVLGGGDENDLLVGGAGSDTAAYRSARRAVWVDLGLGSQDTNGAGTDTLDSIENVTGSDFGDRITGSAGANRLDGGGGDDFLVGGGGDDVLDGGSGFDTADYGSATAAVRLSLDTEEPQVAGGVQGTDTLLAIEGLIGGAGNDVLGGNAGNNLLDGRAGDDRVRGNAGDDVLIGGEGIDTVTYAGAAVRVRVNLHGGRQNTGEGADTLSGFENLIGSAFRDVLHGNAGSNLIDGGDGDDVLDGWTGADRLVGRGGNDRFSVNQAEDQVVEARGAGTDVVVSSVAYTLSAHVENLQLTGNATRGTGNNLANLIEGNHLANRLSGEGGDDVLDGGSGFDTMRGGLGDDLYIVSESNDAALEALDAGTDTIRALINHRLGRNIENLELGGGARRGTGNGLANAITGTDFGDRIDGAGGADLMKGGAGDDIYIVGQAGDEVVEGQASGTDTVHSSVSYALAEHIEDLVLTGSAANGTGNGLDNAIAGNAAANILDGAGGADRLRGGAGDDVYYVDDSADHTIETSEAGFDIVLASASHALGNHVEDLILTGSSAINGTGNNLVNRITGGDGDNRLSGAGGADALVGGGGDDRLSGGEGGDELHGGLGYDSLFGDAGSDLIVGSAGNDALSGGSENDLLFGGVERDRLTGGTGEDRFHFDTALDPAVNVDLVTDFTAADDTIMLDRAIFEAIGADGVLAASAFREGDAAADANDRIVYNIANGNLYYDADGAGGADHTLFAKVAAGTALTNVDFIAYSEAAEALRTDFEAL
ncbi:MAG TPA: FG-GAP-like repeat-containing protein [Allosphingosinicella sp.]|nr:FG-GAP-like repeat-containing protein [Allosphingosinicella sp.]